MSRSMTARARRADRRARARQETKVAGPEMAHDLDPLVAGASGGDFPLSDRGRPWDVGGANGRWRTKSGSTDAPSGSYKSGFFWYDGGSTDQYGSYKLQFVDVINGDTTAVWRAVTACAGIMQGARGGVNIPDGDKGGVRSKIEGYYAKARSTYKDPSIEVPWSGGKSSVEEVAYSLAYAEVGNSEELPEREAFWTEMLEEGIVKPTVMITTTTAANATTSTFANPTVVELPSEHQPGESIPKRNPSPQAPMIDPNRTNASQVRWEATLCPEGTLTDDGRMFAPGSITWRQLPLSLMVMTETGEGHDGAWLGGRIDRIWRDGNQIRGEGVFTEDEGGQRAAQLVSEGALTGISVDIAVKEYEVASKGDLLDEEGNMVWPMPEQADRPEPSLLDILFGEDDGQKVFVVTDGVIGAATVCPFPAFADANISLTAAGLLWTVKMQAGFRLVRQELAAPEEPSEELDEGLTAAAAGMAPLVPPAEWFENPELGELTPLHVTDEGRVYGHAAGWDTCHIGIPDACTVAPHSKTDYSLFHLGALAVEDDAIPIGKITLGTGHAPRHMDWKAAASHYDNTGTVVADVVVGEDEYGIWVNGALRPDISAERVRELRAAVLSGDWRSFNGNLELVALLAVNVPGFPIPRKRALVAAGDEGAEVLTLLSAGITTGIPDDLSEDDVAKLRELASLAAGKPGQCGCGHEKMSHKDGSGECSYSTCSCKKYSAYTSKEETAADAQDAGECKCGHMAASHADSGNGACAVKNCACDGFEPATKYEAQLMRLAMRAKGIDPNREEILRLAKLATS